MNTSFENIWKISKQLITYYNLIACKRNKVSFIYYLLISARKLTMAKQCDVSTTSCHRCQMNKLEITENAYL